MSRIQGVTGNRFVPVTLRGQFAIALCAVAVPVLIGGVTAVCTLRSTVTEAGQLSNACLAAAWLGLGLGAACMVWRLFIGRLVLARLQAVCRGLRAAHGECAQHPRIPVQGDDEIGEMARTVERLLLERDQLVQERSRLAEGQRHLAAVIDSTVDGIVVLNDLEIVQLNPAAERMFGVRQRQIVGQGLGALLPEFALRADGSCGFTCETLARTGTGTEFPVEVSVSPSVHQSSQMTVLVVRDATLRKQAEQQLVAARDAAEAGRAAQARFLANVSHELRTPLNAVLGFAQLLLFQSSLTEDQRAAVGTIRRSGEHLLALIVDLLDLAKSEAGTLDVQLAPVHLIDSLQTTADIIRVQAVEAGLDFHCRIGSDVPANVIADDKRLRQVLLNLLGNAVKFTDRGEVSLWVSVIRRRAKTVALRFDVRDTGIGMRQEQLDVLFRPFSQVCDARRRGAGTGLGLCISSQLVRLMGGEISVSSVPGKGSNFAFDLELRVAQDSPAPSGPPKHGIVGYEGPRVRVLIVDDVASNRARLGHMLRPLGFDVVEAADGRQAVDQARIVKPDLVITEIALPVMTGRQAIRQLRRSPFLWDVRVIAVSTESNAAEVGFDLAKFGADAFVPKPLDCEKVLREIGACLSLRWVFSHRSLHVANV